MPTGLNQTTWFPIRGFDDSSPSHEVSADMAAAMLNVEIVEKGVKKREGTEAVNSSIISATAGILHIDSLKLSNGTDYDLINTSDGKIYKLEGTAITGTVLTGFTTGEPVYTAQLLDKMIFAQGTTAMRTWDGTSSGTISASPAGKYIVTHLEKLWAAGISGQLSLVSYSATGDVDTWSGTGTGDINISQNDGQVITGLMPFRNDLVVFKSDSIYRIIGYTSDSFTVVNVSLNIGCVEHRTIRNAGNFLIWAYKDGIYVYDGSQVEKVSDYQQVTWNTINHNRYRYFASNIYKDKGEYQIAFPTGSSVNNDTMLIYYYNKLFRDDQGRLHIPCTKWEGDNYNAIHSGRVSITNTEINYFGSNDGFLLKRSNTVNNDRGDAIEAYCISPMFTGGSLAQTINMRRAYVPLKTNAGILNIYFNNDDNDNNFTLVEEIQGQAGSSGDGLGVTFEIGVSAIGGVAGASSFVSRSNFNGLQGVRVKIKIGTNETIRTWEINQPVELFFKYRGHKKG